MSAKATPINQLQSSPNQQSDTLVNDILREIDQTNNNPEMSNDDIAAKQAQYQMDPVAQSQQYMGDNVDPQQQQMMQQQMMQQQQQQQMMQQEPDMGQMDPSLMYGGEPSQTMVQKTLLERIIEESKSPIIVATLCVLVSYKGLDSQLIKFIPKGLSTTGEITTIGLIVKGLIAGILFYLVKKFI